MTIDEKMQIGIQLSTSVLALLVGGVMWFATGHSVIGAICLAVSAILLGLCIVVYRTEPTP